jgi:hypothetical protein
MALLMVGCQVVARVTASIDPTWVAGLGLQLETKAILHQLFSLRIQKNVPVDFLVDGFARCLAEFVRPTS